MSERDTATSVPGSLTPEERANQVSSEACRAGYCPEHGTDGWVPRIAAAIREAVAEALAGERQRIAAQINDSCAPPWGDTLAALVKAGGGWGCRIDPAAEEREACAKVAEDTPLPHSQHALTANHKRAIAAAIRSRK